MKKITMILFCVLLAVLTVLPAAAAAPDRPDGSEALGAAWEWYEKVPDYSGGFWIGEDGVLTVGLVDEAGKAEVLAIVGDAPVNFVTQTYSYNALMAVQDELMDCYEQDVGLMTIGVDIMNNVTEVGIDRSNPKAAPFVEEMAARYGDRITFRDMTGMQIIPVVDGTFAGDTVGVLPQRNKGGLNPAVPVAVICVVGLAGAAWLLSWPRRMARAADGRTVELGAPLTRRGAEDAVRQAEEYPDTTLRDIVEKLEQ